MAKSAKPKIGRPPHADPPVFIATNLPKSLRDQLKALAGATDIPMSEHLADAVAAYLWRARQLKSYRPNDIDKPLR